MANFKSYWNGLLLALIHSSQSYFPNLFNISNFTYTNDFEWKNTIMGVHKHLTSLKNECKTVKTSKKVDIK